MKLAIICGGRSWRVSADEDRQLRHTQGSVVKARETLEDNDWQCPDTSAIEDERTYKEFLSDTYHCENINEFLFYYTGHGFSNNDIPFRIYLENHSMQFVDLIKATKEALGGYPAKIGFVIDACYSGGVIDVEIPSNVEILTSTNEDSQAFEKDTYGTSVFTKFFCEAFNTPHDTDEIDLKCIGKHVEQEGKNVTREGSLDPFHIGTPSFRQGRIVVGYVKEINEIKKVLKEEYPAPRAFRKAIFDYYSSKSSNFDLFRESESFDALFGIVIREKECLYCMVKKLGQTFEILEDFNDTDCESMEGEAENSKRIDRVIIIIKEGMNGLNDCSLSGYLGYSMGSYSPVNQPEAQENDLSNENSALKIIERYISTNLKERKLDRTIELQLIVPNRLMAYDYQKMNIALRHDEPVNDRFHILTRLVYRIVNRHLSDANEEIELWEKNSGIFKAKVSDTMDDNLVTPFENRSSIATFNKDTEHIYILSNSPLSDYAALIEQWGVPFLFYPHESLDLIADMDWESGTVKESRGIVKKMMTEYANRETSTHFICDDYYDVDFLGDD